MAAVLRDTMQVCDRAKRMLEVTPCRLSLCREDGLWGGSGRGVCLEIEG